MPEMPETPEIADSTIWAATCDLKARVLRASGPSSARRRGGGTLILESDGFTYRPALGPPCSPQWQDCSVFRVVRPLLALGRPVVGWSRRDGGSGSGRLAGLLGPGAGGLPAADLAVLMNRYRERFAPDGRAPGPEV